MQNSPIVLGGDFVTRAASLLAMCALSSSLAPCARAQQALGAATGAAGQRLAADAVRVGDQNSDGVVDLLVGVPGFNSSCGEIRCMSGASFASGSATTLWSASPASAAANDYFGFSLATAGDLTGDGVGDFVVGAPGDDNGGGSDAGSVYVVDGATHAVLPPMTGDLNFHLLGWSVASVGDLNGDGREEIAMGAPRLFGGAGEVFVLPGAFMKFGGVAPNLSMGYASSGAANFGTALAGGFDLDGDGLGDFAVGSPNESNGSASQSGAVFVYRSSGTNAMLGFYRSIAAGEHLGQSLDVAEDYDGDGVVDVVAGAPEWNGISGGQDGRVFVLSGAKLAANVTPKELHVFDATNVGVASNVRFGACVRSCDDLNQDGVGEILAGTPNSSSSGGAIVISGASAMRVASVIGNANEHLGDCLPGALDDLDGDGFAEFLVGGEFSDNPSADCGTLRCYRLFPCDASAYCTGKTNSLGCVPAIAWTGVASASSSAPFQITCTNVINQKTGLLFYSSSPATLPFQGGFLCAAPPTKRTGTQSSGGSTSGSSCSGSFALDFNARIQSGVDPELVPGAESFGQFWSRDPQSASTTSLSNAIRFLINP